MAISVGKLAPSAAVLAFVGYCAWPSLSDLMTPPPPPKAPAKVAELAASLFSPTMPPVPTRNPWGGLDAAALAAAKAAAKPVDTQQQSEAVVEDAVAETTVGPTNPLAGLRLDATSILGDERVAVINGQVCAAQEIVTIENVSYKIVRVLPYKVVLECDGKIMELAYASTASPLAKSAAGAKGKPTSTTTALATKASTSPVAAVTPEDPAQKMPAAFESLLKQQGGALQSLLKQQPASGSAAGGLSDLINQLNKAGE